MPRETPHDLLEAINSLRMAQCVLETLDRAHDASGALFSVQNAMHSLTSYLMGRVECACQFVSSDLLPSVLERRYREGWSIEKIISSGPFIPSWPTDTHLLVCTRLPKAGTMGRWVLESDKPERFQVELPDESKTRPSGGDPVFHGRGSTPLEPRDPAAVGGAPGSGNEAVSQDLGARASDAGSATDVSSPAPAPGGPRGLEDYRGPGHP